MSKPNIFGTRAIPASKQFMAKEYHRHHGDTHAQVAILYMVSRDPRGFGGTEWLVTRFHDKAGKAYSAIHMVCHDGKEEYLSEYFSCVRKKEKQMIEEWKTFVEEEDEPSP